MSFKKTKAAIVKTVDDTLQSGLNSDLLPLTTQNNLSVILNELSDNHALILTAETVEALSASGVSAHNICSMFRKSFSYLNENPNLKLAFDKGRATLGSKVRATLVDAVFEDRNIQSAIYLDKILSGDTVMPTEVNLNVTSQLSTVSDEDLMRVAFTVDTVETDLDDTLGGGGHTSEE